jgi:putative transposase
MGRVKRIHYGSACYHVCARGNNRRYILEKVEAKEYFLAVVERYQKRMEFKIYAFVVMDNHFHLLLEVDERFGISKVMQGILLAYSIWYRRHEKYVGHVWQGRFTSRLVESEVQLAENIRYIHANPVRAGMVKEEIDYKWSSAQCWGDYKRVDNKVYGLDIVCGDTSDVS